MRPQRSVTTHGAHTSPSSERKIYRTAEQRREIHSEEASRATAEDLELSDADNHMSASERKMYRIAEQRREIHSED